MLDANGRKQVFQLVGVPVRQFHVKTVLAHVIVHPELHTTDGDEPLIVGTRNALL